LRLLLTRGVVTALAGAALLGGAKSLAEERAATRVDVYVDEMIQVVSPAVEGSFDIGSNVRMTGTYSVDVVSGATRTQTVDVVSSATTFSERRHQVNLSATENRHADRSITAAWTLSSESDYTSNTGSVGFTKDILQRMGTVSGIYRLGRDRFGMATGESIEGSATNQALKLGWSHILGRRTKGSVTLEGDYSFCAEALGCQSSPYRYVPVVDIAMDGQGTTHSLMSLRERHPNTRLRCAGSLHLSRALGSDLAVHANYRYYADTWQVQGHTSSMTLAKSLLEERVVLRASARGGWQSPASFYRDNYVEDTLLPEYRSADSELAGVTSAMLRGRMERNWSTVGQLLNFSLSLRVARFWYRYHELTELPERRAWLVGGGANASF
jgi:hypothetical protein